MPKSLSRAFLEYCLWCLTALVLVSLAPATATATATAAAAETSTTTGFELQVVAAPEIKSLLEHHLELASYRQQNDLSDLELDRLLDAAVEDARNLVATLGYFSPEIKASKTGSDESHARKLTITVAEGSPTLVSDIQIRFEGEITSNPFANGQMQQIREQLPLKAGQRFTQDRWDAAKNNALRQLTAERFPLGKIASSQADVDPYSHQAQLQITLDSGRAMNFGEIEVIGLNRYDAVMVRRIMQISAGAAYDHAQLVRAQQRLTDSGFFDLAVITPDTSGDGSLAPLKVRVREVPLQKLVLGVGMNTDEGLRFSAEHTNYKIPGIEWMAVTQLLVNRDTRSLGSELTSQPDDDNWRWVVSGEIKDQVIGSFDVLSQSVRTGRGQRGDHMDRNYYLQYDRAESATSDPSAPAISQSISANYAYTERNFDSITFPTRGWGLAAELGGGTTLAGQRQPYGRIYTRWLGFLPLGLTSDLNADSFVSRFGRMAFRLEGGSIIADSATSIPSTRLFLTGGDTSVRGYSYKEIGVPLPGGQITSGRNMAVASLEWQKPIFSNGVASSLESAVFIDAGSVADTVDSLSAKFGVGAGLRWRSPVGPLQIDLGYGVATERFRLHMNLGFSF